MPRQLTIRGVPDELSRRLLTQAVSAGTTVEALVLSYLEAAVAPAQRRRQLNRYMTWSEQERLEFDAEVRAQRRIDQPAPFD